MSVQVTVIDLGGTHVRFARASIEARQVIALHDPMTLRVAEYPSFRLAWQAYRDQVGGSMPHAAVMAIACPVDSDLLPLTNNGWVLRASTLAATLEVDKCLVVNDFGAVAHAISCVAPESLIHVAGVDEPLPEQGLISVVGPGTGLGVAQIIRGKSGSRVVECEGGHADFAPLDPFEDALLQRLRKTHLRVSIERIVSGPGLIAIYHAVLAEQGRAEVEPLAAQLWHQAISGENPDAREALHRFCRSFGGVSGDIALTHGADAVVLAGGISPRIAEFLKTSGFSDRFTAKGRFSRRMAQIPVRMISHPDPGLFGAAAVFAAAEAA